MRLLGVLVNTVTVLLGGSIGLAFGRRLSERIVKGVMSGIGLCTLYIGISGCLALENALVMILSVVLGAAAGFRLDLDRWLERLGKWVERRFHRQAGQNSAAEAFVTASLLFCVGAMTVVGSLEAGLTGNNRTLLTKALLDLTSSMMLAASLGPGVLCAAAVVLVGQGGLVLLAGALAPLLDGAAVTAMSAVGSLLIVGLGLNLLGVTKLKIANFLPAIVLAPVVQWGYTLTVTWIGGILS